MAPLAPPGHKACRENMSNLLEIVEDLYDTGSPILYQRPRWLTHGGFSNRELDDSSWHGGLGHAVSGEIARGLFG